MIRTCKSFVYLHNTEYSLNAEEYDCIFHSKYPTIKYCIRSNQSAIFVSRSSTTCLHGNKLHFNELIAENIQPWNILSWSSSVEKADEYARVFYNRLESFENDPFLCNCSKGFFGKHCEYQLLFDLSSFSKSRNNAKYHQKWGKILCYETLQCDYGMLCLDWRNICDGQQNCINGIDEENCDLLEFNECENNEYRCVDGMCIAEEYWLDGKLESECILLTKKMNFV